MLDTLHIRNYALIDELEIQFDKGLNIITGETGAGKSIIMGALSLILGSRAEGKHFFDPSRKCVIEGFFNITSYRLADFFAENELDYDEQTIIRREISPDGKSRAFVNDSPVNLAVLRQLGEKLIDVHSQHATLQIGTEDFQLLVLDSVAGTAEKKSAFQQSYRTYRKTARELQRSKEAAKNAASEADYFQFLFDELAEADLERDEQERLENQQKQLENAEDIKRGLLGALHLLESQEANVLSLTKESLNQLDSVSSFLPQVQQLSERLNSVWIEMKDITAEIGSVEDDIYLDEGELVKVNDRLNLLYSLQKKHHVESTAELIGLRDELEQKLLAISSSDEHIAALELQLSSNWKELSDHGCALREARQSVLDKIEQYVQDTLSEVGMVNAQLHIELTPLKEDEVQESGIDAIQFLFAANKGQALQPVGKVASGGELSRLMLAVKSLVAKTSALPTIIFDEIDTGISGEVALRVGEIMERLAQNMQVIAISHLPQIASKGTAHFKVYKEDKADKTISNIVRLDEDGRVKEIAQMLSGAKPTDAAMEHAKLLIKGE